MSKITRLEQFENENSIYRVVGMFPKSELCKIVTRGDAIVFVTTLEPMDVMALTPEILKVMMDVDLISIMCIQRGQVL